MRTELVKGIDWVGGIDWNVRDFHSYSTPRGATYNAYLIQDEKNVLIDSVKAPFADECLERVARFLPPAKLDYIVVNHAEPDHASGLPALLAAAPNATVVADAKTQELLKSYHPNTPMKFQTVKTGDTLAIGKRTLAFVEAPMVHWPDTMFTYCPEERILFPNDAFGQHLATRVRFVDEFPHRDVVFEEAKTYYANIVMPYGAPVAKALAAAAGLDIAMIAPSHGLIWRRPEDIAAILQCYADWKVTRAKPRVIVLYDTMWESTAMMAEAIVEGADQPGVEAKRIWVRRSDLTRIATDFIDVAAAAFGSATLNNTLMPAMAAALTYLQGLRPQNKAGFAFGSYGWAARGGADAAQDYLSAMKWDILREPLKCKNRPTAEILAEAKAAGKLLAERALTAGAQ